VEYSESIEEPDVNSPIMCIAMLYTSGGNQVHDLDCLSTHGAMMR
jgi:hypothetical protein